MLRISKQILVYNLLNICRLVGLPDGGGNTKLYREPFPQNHFPKFSLPIPQQMHQQWFTVTTACDNLSISSIRKPSRTELTSLVQQLLTTGAKQNSSEANSLETLEAFVQKHVDTLCRAETLGSGLAYHRAQQELAEALQLLRTVINSNQKTRYDTAKPDETVEGTLQQSHGLMTDISLVSRPVEHVRHSPIQTRDDPIEIQLLQQCFPQAESLASIPGLLIVELPAISSIAAMLRLWAVRWSLANSNRFSVSQQSSPLATQQNHQKKAKDSSLLLLAPLSAPFPIQVFLTLSQPIHPMWILQGISPVDLANILPTSSSSFVIFQPKNHLHHCVTPLGSSSKTLHLLRSFQCIFVSKSSLSHRILENIAESSFGRTGQRLQSATRLLLFNDDNDEGSSHHQLTPKTLASWLSQRLIDWLLEYYSIGHPLDTVTVSEGPLVDATTAEHFLENIQYLLANFPKTHLIFGGDRLPRRSLHPFYGLRQQQRPKDNFVYPTCLFVDQSDVQQLLTQSPERLCVPGPWLCISTCNSTEFMQNLLTSVECIQRESNIPFKILDLRVSKT